jgi:hypothetical protein
MWKINIKYCVYLFLITVIISVCSCSYFGGSEYSRLVKKELATGKRYDSLFLGIYLGMPAKSFYDHCWDLNKKGLVTNGTRNISVLYKLDHELKHPASMNFYPDFYENKIVSMRVSYEYDAWAPWNKTQQADSLLPDVLRLYKRWYFTGNDFITITNKERGTIYVKVDGNRRITIGQFDDMQVKVDFTDLRVEEKLKLKK